MRSNNKRSCFLASKHARNLIHFFFLVLVMLVDRQPIYACSLALSLPIQPVPGEHVFIGNVVGYADPIKTSDLKHSAWGIRVEVTDIVHLSPPAKQEYEVYFFSTNPACGRDGYSKDYVQSKYGIGTQVQIVASAWNEPSAKYRRVILAVEPFLDARYAAKPSTAKVTTESEFDYTLQRTWDFNRWEESVEETVFSFEWRKDLFRLQNTKDLKQRQAILKRMIAAPYNDDGWFYRYLCPEFMKNSISDKGILEGLLSDCHRQELHYGYINQAKRVLITRLDARLPQRLLGVWWEDLFGAAVDVNWRLQDCGEFGKDVPELQADIPVCVESHVTPGQNRSIILLMVIGATHQVALEPRVLNITVGTEQKENLHFQSLHELAKYVFNKGWASSNPCNQLSPKDTTQAVPC